MSTKETMSEYLLLFRGTHWHQSLSAEEIRKNLERFTAWFERLQREGKIKSGLPLVHTGKIVSGRNAVVDGPFAESKEAIAGFFIIQAENLEAAVESAKECPGLDYGQTVEVRPIAFEPWELVEARKKTR
jgi:hypothetical protein